MSPLAVHMSIPVSIALPHHVISNAALGRTLCSRCRMQQIKPFITTNRHRSRTTGVVAAQQEREVSLAQQVALVGTVTANCCIRVCYLGACTFGDAHGGNGVCWVT